MREARYFFGSEKPLCSVCRGLTEEGYSFLQNGGYYEVFMEGSLAGYVITQPFGTVLIQINNLTGSLLDGSWE